jgi:quercetin dioxygenase-like cupin family protein
LKHIKLVALVTLGALSAHAFAPQDPLAVGKGMYFLKLNNERVRAMVVKFAPGKSIGMHSHPDHVAYAVQGGRLRIHEQGKDPVTMDIPTGATLWLPAQAHEATNIGKTHIKILVVEIK